MGQSPQSKFYNQENMGIPLIQGNADLKDGVTSPRIYTTSVTKKVEVGDIIMSVRAPVGELAISSHEACIGRGVCSIQAKNEQNLFLYYLLQHYRGNITQYSQGSTFDSINSSDIQKVEVPYPTTEEQQKIASILSTWDEAIEKYQNFLELIKLEKEGIAHRAIVQNAPQIGGYRKYKIGEILTYEQPQKYLENDISEEKDKNSVPVLTANKAFVLGYSKNLEGTYHEYPAIIFDDFTTDIKYVDFEFKVRSSAIKILSPKSDDINLKYVYETMNLIRFPLGGHKRHYISEYQYIKVGLPPKEYQDKIANLLTNMDEKIELIDSMIENLKEQKRGLMQLLLTGKVRV